jgi:hypothetical protein
MSTATRAIVAAHRWTSRVMLCLLLQTAASITGPVLDFAGGA